MNSCVDNSGRLDSAARVGPSLAAGTVTGEAVPDAHTVDLLLYGLNFEPELTGIGKYSGEMARWLAQQGHRVDVVTAPPYYPEWKVHASWSGRWYSRDRSLPERLQVLRCPLWVPQRVSGRKRMLHLFSFALSSAPALLLRALKRRPSVLMLVSPTLACAPAALLVGRLLGIPTWLHLQDFELDAMHALGIAKGASRLQRWQFACEAALLARFDRVSSISGKMVERLDSKGVAAARRVQFPNWVDVSFIPPQPLAWEGNVVRATLQLPRDAVVVLYAGNMGRKQGLEVVIDAARALAQAAHIHFVLVGSGAALDDLQRYAADVPAIRWLPLQPIELLNELLNAADIHVLPQQANAADLVMPSKLTGMLASGRPVIGTAKPHTQLGQVLDSCGVRTTPDDAAQLAGAIATLAADAAERARLGRLGRAYALQHLSHTAILSAFERELKALARGA